jgi:hypothetical protein
VCIGRADREAAAAGVPGGTSRSAACLPSERLAVAGSVGAVEGCSTGVLRLHPWPELDPVEWLQEMVRQMRCYISSAKEMN